VDPAAPDGDRLIGYELVQGKVDAAAMHGFLERLRAAGVDPGEVITDGSPLYPATLAAVWPAAAHQLCLFHQTRRVTKSVVQAVREMRAGGGAPAPAGAGGGGGGAPPPADPAAGAVGEPDYTSGPRHVHHLYRQGIPIRAIVRQTGFARHTVRRWLRTAPPAEKTDSATPPDPVSPSLVATPLVTDEARPEESGPRQPPGPPPPWESWAQVRQITDDLSTHRFLFARRPDHLSDDDQACLHALLTSPIGDELRPVRAFMDDWYAIWRTQERVPRTRADAWARYQDWRDNPAYAAYPPLRRLQTQVDAAQFGKLSAFLDQAGWEATNNGAARMGRPFRHAQAPHFTLRAPEAIAGALTAQAVLRKAAAKRGVDAAAARSTRGRIPRQSAPALAA